MTIDPRLELELQQAQRRYERALASGTPHEQLQALDSLAAVLDARVAALLAQRAAIQERLRAHELQEWRAQRDTPLPRRRLVTVKPDGDHG